MLGSASATRWRQRLKRSVFGLYALNAVLFGAFTLPRALEERSLEQNRAALLRERERERRVVARLRERAETIRGNVRDSERFYGELVAAEKDLVSVLRELDRAAPTPGNRSFRSEEVRGARVQRFAVTMPLAGSYEQLVAFLRRMEGFPRFVTVDRVALREAEGGAGLDVVVSAYYRPDREGKRER
jgi:Tfp pilus assembly protein PilO